ncbi:MAG TPA: DUF6328 family protein [Nitrososphaeraceae archaeon]|nr:DUF6328 family protein [Nitrososphaeraceae archaeon]
MNYCIKYRVSLPDDDTNETDDKLVQRYDTILKESALLSTFAGILFGFLLNMAINVPDHFEFIDKVTLIVALYSTTVAASLFVMPVVYHHLQYPYGSLDKFKSRSHRFIILGLIPAGLTLYLGLQLAIHSLLGSIESFLLASLPFILVYFLFRARKGEFLKNL